MSGGVKSFEELDIWKMAKLLTAELFVQTRGGLVGKDFGFRDQLRNAALSIMNNIAEGFGRRSDRAFIHFLNYSKGSAAEVESMLILAEHIGYFEESQVAKWRKDLRAIASRICGLQEYLRNNIRTKRSTT